MGAPVPEFETSENANTEALLELLKSIAPSERRKHATVFNYWLSIRGNRQLPLIRDLDPLEISDAGPQSVLLEVIGGGGDADIRHLGATIKAGADAEKISEVFVPSLLSCIARNLPVVVASSQPFAFEDQFDGDEGPTRCWVTLLPFSAGGALVEYVYGFVSLEPGGGAVTEPAESRAEPAEEDPEPDVEEAEAPAETATNADRDSELVLDEAVDTAVSAADKAVTPAAADPETAPVNPDSSYPGFSGAFSKILETSRGFYGRVADVQLGQWQADDVSSDSPLQQQAAEEQEENLHDTQEAAEQAPDAPSAPEGGLHARLAETRAKADEARLAKLRGNIALYEGLGAAYDFAFDAENEPEDYLRLVEAKGLKIQLRSPMASVVKLAFDGMCDEPTIAQLEAVLGWALEQDLPRGSLAERIEAEGGIGAILSSLESKA